MKFDPAATAEFDQSHARVRDAVDGLIDGLMMAGNRCSCGESVDSPRHTLLAVDYIGRRYSPDQLAMLLGEAVTRLAVARGAK